MDPEASPLDRAALDRLEQWGGPQLRSKMIDLFLEHAPGRVAGIRHGLQATAGGPDPEDPALAERSAHSLKSSAANLGAESVRELAARIERALEIGDRSTATELLPELEARFFEAIDALRRIRGKESG